MPKNGFSMKDLLYPQKRKYNDENSETYYKHSNATIGRNMAKKILKSLKITSIPVELDPICHYLAVQVKHITVSELNALGRYIGDGIIEIAKGLPDTLFRSTLAHELGHVALQHDIRPRWDTLESLNDPDPHEKEAWDFAGALLMPENILKQKIKEGSVNNSV